MLWDAFEGPDHLKNLDRGVASWKSLEGVRDTAIERWSELSEAL